MKLPGAQRGPGWWEADVPQARISTRMTTISGRLRAVALLLLCLAPAALAQDDAALTVHLFYSPSCPDCHAVRTFIADVLSRHPEVKLQEYSLSDPHNIELMADFYDRYGVDEEQWGGSIAVFVGNRWWEQPDRLRAEFEQAIEQMTAAGPAAGEGGGSAHDRLVALFERLGPVTVALAGLADGINPCALAALIFLISYLTFAGRSPREILATGLLFAAGVFAAYLGVGIGMFRGLQCLRGFELASKLLYPAMAVGTGVLTSLSVRDWLRARAGSARDMTLKLPRRLVGVSHSTIRRLVGSPAFLALAFVAGLAISLLELLCTGQIYLPTLMYIASTESLRGRALALLLVYVALFTLPVLVLTVAAYVGVTSERIAQWGKRHTAGAKLALAVVFGLLTIYLVAFSLDVWIA